ncbi:putative transcription factor [Scheffersomyces amazonensis]|uniref:putative transcription factor n=1 Tax=Scheffersomyces amazonensis TaxID=1078765 RepID=UPI00315C8268
MIMPMSSHSKQRLRLIIPAASRGAKVLKTCTRCRKHKTKCDALITNPLPCSHCAKKSMNCTLELMTKAPERSSIDLVEKLASEVNELNEVLDRIITRKSKLVESLINRGKTIQLITNKTLPKLERARRSSLTPSVSAIQSCISSPEDVTIITKNVTYNQFDTFTISTNLNQQSFSLTYEQAYHLFSNYETNFNKFLPIFPDNFFPNLNLETFKLENELLFWCIILTSFLNDPLENSASNYAILSEHIKSLVVEKCWFQTPRSVYVISALLILTTWPLPNLDSKIADNLCIKFISTMKSLSLQFGLHKLDFIEEFSHKTKMNISQEVNLNNLIRERIYKFVNINSNYWLINLGLSNNNYNGFTQDYIINKASNKDLYDKTSESDKFINSLLKISIIQTKLNENMNDLIGNNNENITLLPNQINTCKLINFNMFEIILEDLNRTLINNNNPLTLNNLLKISIEFSKLQLFIYAFSKSDISLMDYKIYISKIISSCCKILSLYQEHFSEGNSISFNQLPIQYSFPIELSTMVLIRVFKSPILNMISDYKLVKEKFNEFYKGIILSSNDEWKFLHAKFFKVLEKFDKVDNIFIMSKMVTNTNTNSNSNSNGDIVPSFFLINKLKSYLVSSLAYELIWLIYQYENNNNDNNNNSTDYKQNLNWQVFGVNESTNGEFIQYIQSNESIFN